MPERATVMNRSEKSAKAVVAGGFPGEGPNEKDSHERCRLDLHCIRSLGNQGARGRDTVKPCLKP